MQLYEIKQQYMKIFDQKFHFLETTLNSEEYSPKEEKI